MEAQIALTGNVGSEVELTQGEGYTFARFRLGCTPRVRKGDVWADGETTWVGVSTSRRLAQHVKDSVKKGQPVVVVGRLRTHTWVDKTGERHETLQVVATAVGHDLTWGTAAFTRAPKAEDRPAPDAGRVVVDPDTGEVLEPEDDGDVEEEELAA